jgi:hypothetical protein
MPDDRGIGLILKMQRETTARIERGQSPQVITNIVRGYFGALAASRQNERDGPEKGKG